MSLSLTLVFDKFSKDDGPIFAFNRLQFDSNTQRLKDALLDVTLPLAEGIYWPYERDGSAVKTDEYGQPLTYVSAGLLAARVKNFAQSQWEHSIVAFVKTLPVGARVGLYWE